MRKSLSKYCRSNHETMTNDNVADSLLLTFDWLLTAFSFSIVFKLKDLFLFIFKYLFKNNMKGPKWSSKLKTKRNRMRFKVIVFCKKYLSWIIIEKHLVKFTFKLAFVYPNVTEGNYIPQRTKKKQESLICLIKDYLLWN